MGSALFLCFYQVVDRLTFFVLNLTSAQTMRAVVIGMLYFLTHRDTLLLSSSGKREEKKDVCFHPTYKVDSFCLEMNFMLMNKPMATNKLRIYF